MRKVNLPPPEAPGPAWYGTRVFGLRTGTAQTLRVRLSRTGARSLARRHRLAVRARALLPRPGGAIAVASRHYRLR